MDSYSITHTYIYKDKPAFISGVDKAFAPLGYFFGGKTIDLLSPRKETETNPSLFSKSTRIAGTISVIALSIFYSLFCAGLGAVLVLKVGCGLWERSRVIDEGKSTLRCNALFRNTYESGRYLEALHALESRPSLATHFSNELLDIGNRLAESEETVEHLSKVSSLYATTNDSIKLFRLILETKFQNNILSFNLGPVKKWIKNLHLSNDAALIYCHSILDLFKIKAKDDFLINIIRLNAGIGIIRTFENYKRKNPTEPKIADSVIEESNLDQSDICLTNFNGELLKNVLLEDIPDKQKTLYLDVLHNKTSCHHLSSLISALRHVQNLEVLMDDEARLIETYFDPTNSIGKYEYKKKIAANAKRFLEQISTQHYTHIERTDRLPELSNQLNYFIKSKQKNIQSNCEYYNNLLNLAEDLLTQSRFTKFNTSKFNANMRAFKERIYGETGGPALPQEGFISDLYGEYFLRVKQQLYYIEHAICLITQNN